MKGRNVNARVMYVADEAEVQDKLQGSPAIFLSAGVPYLRSPPQGVTRTEQDRRVRQNKAFVDLAAPEETIRSAVVLLTREVLRRGMRLVFGAQPAIGAMVLSIGRDMVPKSERKEPRILIFQSRYFEAELPGSTLDLAAWESGVLVFTAEARVRSPHREARRNPSLRIMRELMVSVPNLRAGVFIGGMEGVTEEAGLFRQKHPDKPMYPLVSTGSAARLLYEAEPRLHAASPDSPSLPNERISYSLVAKDILDQIE